MKRMLAWPAISFMVVGRLCAQTSDTPSANPGRPTVATPATLTPVGYVQFENGYLGSLTSPETSAQYGVNQVTKLALHSRVQVGVQWQPYAASQAFGDTSFTNGFGDVLLGGQVVLFTPTRSGSADPQTAAQKKTPVPTIALAYYGRVDPGNTADVDLGSYNHSLYVLFSGDVHAFHYDFNAFINEQVSGGIRRLQTAQTISINHSLGNDRLQLAMELYHFTQPFVTHDEHARSVDNAQLLDLLIAPSYQVRPNLILDAGFTHGFTSTSTRWQSFAGFTYLLPKRLWPKHHR